MASSRLRREIEALLYKRWRGLLDPVDPRGPVLGMRTSAGAALRESIPVPLVFLMESGWLTFENRGGGTLPYVYTYSPTWLTKYTLVPTGVSLDGNRSYESEFTRTTYTPVQYTDALSRHRPERYSGLMRLFVQALVGANRTIDDVCSTEIVPSRALAQWNGLIRSPGGAYWHTWLNRRSYLGSTYNSIRARKLKVPVAMADAYADLQAWSGNMSAKDASYLEAYVLSSLEYDTTATTRTLVAEGTASLNSMFASGWVFMPWGICWRHQARGATDQNTCGAVWTVRNQGSTGSAPYQVFFQTFRRAMLDITFASEVPSATFTVADTERTEFNSERGPNRVYWMDLTTPTELFSPSTDIVSGISDTALDPVVCLSWYGSDGELHELTFARELGEEIENSSYDNGPICGAGIESEGYAQETSYQLCKFAFDGVDLIDPATYHGNRRIEQDATTARVNLTEETFTGYSASGLPGGVCNGATIDGSTQYDMVRYRGVSQTTIARSDYTRLAAVSALIISDIPGVAWVMNLGNPDATLATADETRTATGTGAIYREEYTATSGPGPSFTALYTLAPVSFAPSSSSSPVSVAHQNYTSCINDADVTLTDGAATEAMIEWLGTPTANWDWSLTVGSFTPDSPAVALAFQPAVCGYMTVREMFGAGRGDAFNAQAYESLGRLIGGA